MNTKCETSDDCRIERVAKRKQTIKKKKKKTTKKPASQLTASKPTCLSIDLYYPISQIM